jgi:SIT family siderophore-iron:H+ symporter-like MFS transporter
VEYFYTVLRVGYRQSTQSATRIVNLYNFTSVITGAIVGLLVYRIRYLRPFIIIGTVLYFAAFALLIVFNGGGSSKAQCKHISTM